MKKVLKTPISKEDIADIRVGDIIFLDGYLITGRDVVHRRVIELGRKLPFDLEGGAVLHAGPIVAEEGGKYHMISIGPTTSMRMERFEKEFIAETGVRLVIGKGGMGRKTAEGCQEYSALHCVFPGGCAVVGATAVEEIEGVEWLDLGMPEAVWIMRVKEFGPLIVSIDTEGNNLFETNKVTYQERKERIVAELVKNVGFIK